VSPSARSLTLLLGRQPQLALPPEISPKPVLMVTQIARGPKRSMKRKDLLLEALSHYLGRRESLWQCVEKGLDTELLYLVHS
jgi:hypothetical protein